MGYSPWGHKESDTTEGLSIYHGMWNLPRPGIEPWAPCIGSSESPQGRSGPLADKAGESIHRSRSGGEKGLK